MRQYKFRAWDGKQMNYDYRDVSLWNGILVAEGDTILMQFTGLKDRLGKDIYEGDVLKSYEGIFWKVQWNDEKAEFELAWCGGPQPVYYRAGMYLIKDTHCEVIGNIYEHPELTHGQA